MLKIVSENFIHALLLFLGLFLKISRWVPLIEYRPKPSFLNALQFPPVTFSTLKSARLNGHRLDEEVWLLCTVVASRLLVQGFLAS